ncbi:MAG TPA: retroviral-like aspartic protease family protein [Acidobacteriaceae bacterium]
MTALKRWSLLLFCLFSVAPAAVAVSCPVLHSAPSQADTAFLHANYDQAAALYGKILEQKPNDPGTVAALSRVLLRQQNYKDARELVTKAESAHPHNAMLEAAQGAVELRAGKPWKAITTVKAAWDDNPCEPQVHMVWAQINRLLSNYATQKSEIDVAHQLSPDDPDIRGEWIGTLPVAERIDELKAYLSQPNGDDAEDRDHDQKYLEHLEQRVSAPHKSCHLASPVAQTEIPFVYLMEDANRIRAFGLDVKINDKSSRLEIDTGAGGIYVSHAVAQRANLKPLYRSQSEGIGDHGPQSGYVSYADSIRIGGLEFRDCLVYVSDRRNILDSDGLVGMDVFSDFLIGLDYPMRKLTLAPLPPRPGEENNNAPSLNTDQAEGAQASSAVASQGSSSKASSTAPPLRHNRYVAPEMKSYALFYRNGHDILLPTQLNGKSVRLFMVDTGAFATTISPEAAREITKVHSDSSATVRGISGKVEKVYTGNKVVAQFAGIRQEIDDIYAFDTSRLSKDAGMEISGFLGFTTLQVLTIHIDYRDGLVKFDYTRDRGYNHF